MPARKVWEGNSIQKVFFILGLAPGAIRLARVCSAPLQWAVASVFPAFEDLAPHDCIVSRFFIHFLLSAQKKVAKKSAHELMRFLLRKTAAGPDRSRLSFCCAKRHYAWSTAIAVNSGFLFQLIRQSRMHELT